MKNKEYPIPVADVARHIDPFMARHIKFTNAMIFNKTLKRDQGRVVLVNRDAQMRIFNLGEEGKDARTHLQFEPDLGDSMKLRINAYHENGTFGVELHLTVMEEQDLPGFAFSRYMRDEFYLGWGSGIGLAVGGYRIEFILGEIK